MQKFVWARLGQTPKGVMWPVEVVEEDASNMTLLVFCHADNAW